MKSAALLAAVVGCATEDPPEVWFGPEPASIDVVVANGYVQVFASPATSVFTAFAAPSSCVETSDAGGPGGTCLQRMILDGVSAFWNGSPSTTIHSDDPHALILEGCGREIEIPLASRDIPTPSGLVHSRDATSITIEWTSDLPASSALVSVSTGFVGEICHVVGASSHRFARDPEWPVRTTTVMTFAEAETLATPLGLVHVWYGASIASDDRY